MRFANKTVPLRQIAALSLSTLAVAWGVGCCATASFAEEAADDASDLVTAEQADEAQTGSQDGHEPVIRLYSSSYSSTTDDPNLQDVKTQACYTVSFSMTSDVASRDAMYDAIDALRASNGVGAIVRDAELERVAFQRASESYLLHSAARPDGTLFYTAGSRAFNELLAWGTRDDNVNPNTLLVRLTWGDRDTELDWVLKATNVGCALLTDADGNTYWAVEFAYDGLSSEGNRPAEGNVTCYVNIASSCVQDISLPATLELKSGEAVEVPVSARAAGTLSYGDYTADFTGVPVTVLSWCFIWNTSNVRVASITSDGTLTAVSAGTVTVSATDQDSTNPRFMSAIVDGGSKATVYSLADCTIMGITGDDGLGNLYLNESGTVNMPAFQIATPANSIIDSVNYTATIEYDAQSGTATLTVKAKTESTVCKGTVSKTFKVIDPAAANAQTPAIEQAVSAEDEVESATEAASDDTAEPSEEAEAEESSPVSETVLGTRSIQGGQLTMSFTSTTFTGIAITPSEVEVTVNGTVLEQGRDYTVSYSDNVNVGQATATATGIGEYTGTLSATYAIQAADLSLASVTMPNQAYTGTHLYPKPVSAAYVYGGSAVALTEGVDYEVVKYSDNIEVGNATAVLEGIGNFTGTLNASWKVVNAGTQDPGTTQTIPQTSSDDVDLVGMGLIAGLCALLVAAVAGIVVLARRLIRARR